jgi:hypothetical protein
MHREYSQKPPRVAEQRIKEKLPAAIPSASSTEKSTKETL